MPRWRSLRAATRWRRRISSTSSTFWTSSTSDQREANASSAYTTARRVSGSSGVAYRPWTVLTTIGTPARRPTTRPYSPGFGLCVCSTVGRSRRRIRHSSRAGAEVGPRVPAACRCDERDVPHAAPLDLGDERPRRADPDGLTTGGDDRVELRPEEQRQAHVDRRQVGDAQRPRRPRPAASPGPVELGHRDARGVVDAVAAEDHADGAGEDADVEAERRVVDVPDVEGQPFVPRRRVATVHLGPAGDARPHLQPAGLRVVVAVEVARPAAAAARRAPSRRARRGRASGSSSRLVDRRNRPTRVRRSASCCGPASSGARRSHRAELDELERPAAATAPSLAEQHRRAVDDPHDDGDRRQQRGGDDEQRGGDDDVDRPLHHDRDPTARRVADDEHDERGDGQRGRLDDRVTARARCGRRRRRSRPAAPPAPPAGPTPAPSARLGPGRCDVNGATTRRPGMASAAARAGPPPGAPRTAAQTSTTSRPATSTQLARPRRGERRQHEHGDARRRPRRRDRSRARRGRGRARTPLPTR